MGPVQALSGEGVFRFAEAFVRRPKRRQAKTTPIRVPAGAAAVRRRIRAAVLICIAIGIFGVSSR